MRAPLFHRLALYLLLIVYLAVRFWRLTDSCLWFDEIFSVHAAEHSWPGLFSFVARDIIHPPLFYALLKMWITIGGESVFWLRLLPVLLSFIAVIPFLLLCRAVGLQRATTLFAFLFFAVNGPLIKYSQEVRMYSLLMCLALFSIWLFVRWQREEKGIVPLTIINILLVYTHYAGWLIVGTEFLAVVLFRRDLLKRFCIISVVLIVTFLPWFLAVSRTATGSGLAQNISWVERPGVGLLFQFLLNLCEPFYAPVSSIDPVSVYRVAIPILLLCALAAIVFAARERQTESHRSIDTLWLLATVPVVLLFVASWIFPYSIWGSRHLIVVFPLFSILFASSVAALKIDWLRTSTITLVLLFIGYGFVLQIQRPVQPQVWCSWEQLAPRIEQNGQPQKLYVFEDLIAYQFWFATRGRSDLQIVKVNGVPDMVEDKAYFLPRGFDDVKIISVGEITGDHFWVAFRDMKWDERHPPLNLLLDRGYKLGQPETIDAGGLKAFLVEIRQ